MADVDKLDGFPNNKVGIIILYKRLYIEVI